MKASSHDRAEAENDENSNPISASYQEEGPAAIARQYEYVESEESESEEYFEVKPKIKEMKAEFPSTSKSESGEYVENMEELLKNLLEMSEDEEEEIPTAETEPSSQEELDDENNSITFLIKDWYVGGL